MNCSMQQGLNKQVQRPIGEPGTGAARRQRDGGYLLLAILLMMALMIIAATIVAPRVVQQIKRDREEEMIHRGTEYARAIKKYYKKFGSYPSTLEQLDTTNQIRFLRKRYKDPLTKDGKVEAAELRRHRDSAKRCRARHPGSSLGVAERIVARRRPNYGALCIRQPILQLAATATAAGAAEQLLCERFIGVVFPGKS